MNGSEEFNIVVISDLHLSAGRNPLTKRFNRNEDFFFDDKFGRFLDFLGSESNRMGRKWRLIIAGDMVDFLQVTDLPDESLFPLRKSERKYGLGTSPDKTEWKLKAMMDGHWIFFKALGGFLSNGNRCTIISGNHDIEWTVPEIQRAFREEMRAYLPRDASDSEKIVSAGIEFCPWFYYEPGLIWVEHGHQYDGMNSFDFLLAPYLPKSSELMLPSGSFFVRYLFNKVEQKDPFADNIKPISAYLRKHFRNLFFSKRILKNIKYFLKILFKAKVKEKKFKPEELEELRNKNEERIIAEANRFGIKIGDLEAIKNHWVPSFIYNKGRLFNLCSFVCYSTGDTHRRMASLIQRKLGVKYVIFGHTHEADLLSLSPGGKAEYANSGTWTKIFSENFGERLLHEEQESVFVRITKDEDNKIDLMKWRDDLGQGERVGLFS